jgi:hypothetical protein
VKIISPFATRSQTWPVEFLSSHIDIHVESSEPHNSFSALMLESLTAVYRINIERSGASAFREVLSLGNLTIPRSWPVPRFADDPRAGFYPTTPYSPSRLARFDTSTHPLISRPSRRDVVDSTG